MTKTDYLMRLRFGKLLKRNARNIIIVELNMQKMAAVISFITGAKRKKSLLEILLLS